MTDKSKDSDVFDMLDKAVSFYENNKDTFKSVVPDDHSVTIDDEEPLKQALVDEDKAMITVDVGTDDIKDIKLALDGTTAKITVGGISVTAEVPSDVNMDDASAVLNNGVLEVQMPRKEDEE